MESQDKDTIKKAIEVLGAPVMHYSPAFAVKEYDEKIKNAVSLLLNLINRP